MNAPQDTSGAEVTTLDGLFRSRVAQTPEVVAYRQFDAEERLWRAWRWEEVAAEAARWCGAFRRDGLLPGDRVAVMLPNCVEWVIFDQAAFAAGLVTVPLFHADNAHNCAHVLRDAGARVVVAGGANAIAKLRGE